ncbi:MAG: thiamine pyrophosphate-dependent dehydrogenase E1 component subunit alpha [Lachnospiraceae bacterium]|nr:thiamine pyrophosphate-dependent dehydrogenase E1 component subunit alpha [Lachnospiraceae bacterium]
MIEKERARTIYRTMIRIRRVEQKALDLFEANKRRDSVQLYIGEEAVASMVCSRLKTTDYIASTHRGHGHCIAKGADLDKAMAVLKGKATGYCKGRSGSMHIADLTQGNLGANAIVGGGIPIAVGSALASKLQHNQNVSVSFFGDGASNEGTFHESLNLAAVWKLPIVFVCENNLYGISVPTWQSTSVKDISVRAQGYDMPGYTVDGNDVEAIDEVFAKAYERAAAGEGPSLIECKTYRWMGHWTGDPQPYRTREEVAEWKEKCPIKRYRAKLLEQGLFTEEELNEIEAAAKKEAEEAAEFALNSPEPDPAGLLNDVFYEGGAE